MSWPRLTICPCAAISASRPGSREEILGVWGEQDAAGPESISATTPTSRRSRASKGAFRITLQGGDVVEAAHVVMAIGDQGELRKMGVPGDDLPCVQYQLDDPEAHDGETIVVNRRR